MVVFLVRELTPNLPTATKVEFHRHSVRLNNSKSARLVTTGSYLGFGASKQSAADAGFPVLAKYPEVTNPVLTCQCNADTHARDQSSSSSLRGTGLGAKSSAKVSFATVLINSRTSSCSSVWGVG
jgi:hypothetical protein